MCSTSNTLDGYLNVQTTPQTVAEHTSQEIRDRGSTFVANLYSARSPAEAQAQIRHVKQVVHAKKPATHEISAWRCMTLKSGRTGLEGPEDFEVRAGFDDDGEKWAGRRVLKVMETHGVLDAVVIVSRWFGGELLYSSRFTHIETCASEVCKEFTQKEELRECISTLKQLDAVLAGLREEYDDKSYIRLPSTISKPRGGSSRGYDDIDLTKAKRLVTARQNSIKSVQSLLEKRSKYRIDVF